MQYEPQGKVVHNYVKSHVTLVGFLCTYQCKALELEGTGKGARI